MDYKRIFSCPPSCREKLAPQKVGRVPLDMDQFRMLFCTCKVPGVTKDTIHNYFKTGGIPDLQSLRHFHPEPVCSSWYKVFGFSSFSVREWGSMSDPSGRDVSWTDFHVWCSLRGTNSYSTWTAQVFVIQKYKYLKGS